MIMSDEQYFDELGHFVIRDYSSAQPFSSFLPGIAGVMGVPMWVFYVNRGQGIAGFGIEDKNSPVMEFQPANKAYRDVTTTGFRTFIKIYNGDSFTLYEPFSALPQSSATEQTMAIGMNELELQETSEQHHLQTNVLYFMLTDEPFAGLVRQVTIKNTSDRPVTVDVLDGLPAIIPYGVDDAGLKNMARTLEAWMDVFNLDENIPFYRVRASVGDTAEVVGVKAGHFMLSFIDADRLLTPIVDPAIVFGQNTSLSYPYGFHAQSSAELAQTTQYPVGKTPCGFVGQQTTLQPGESLTLYSIIGHVKQVEVINEARSRVTDALYIQQKRMQANALTQNLTDAVAIQTSSPLLDAYTRQTFLDNVLRGGWPMLLGDRSNPAVYHVYSRKHGDLERDYNAFFLSAEHYSQGNGSYRDINQNRREDVWLEPGVKEHNIVSFMNLIQADGYNPLAIMGSRFVVPKSKRAVILKRVENAGELDAFLSKPFTPGELLTTVAVNDIVLKDTTNGFLHLVIALADQQLEVVFGEGYWIDHWTYNLDLIENYLAIYPDQQEDLLFHNTAFTYYDNAAIVQSRRKKYVLADGQPRQFNAVVEDEEKAALIASREKQPNAVRTQEGHGNVYHTTLIAKLFTLALVKFSSLDPSGMGVEMEADKPGWYDAVNGLPSLFASSLPETIELLRLVNFMREMVAAREHDVLTVPVEVDVLLQQIVRALNVYVRSQEENRDMLYWGSVSVAREIYRAHTRLGFDGVEQPLALGEVDGVLNLVAGKLRAGIDKATAMNDGIPPTYLTHTVEEYDELVTKDAQGRPNIDVKRFSPQVLPLFLESPVRALKCMEDEARARELYNNVRASDLYDEKLKMYRVNASLEDQPLDIGRARAFTSGWLENGSIWSHMAYKYLLATLKAGLYAEFYEDFKNGLVAFQDPAVYGRSPLENSSFIASSLHPDPSLHGRGFVARLSGATVEYLSILHGMMIGKQPFFMREDALCLQFQPVLPAWLFDAFDTVTFTFLGKVMVTLHNPARGDTFGEGAVGPVQVTLTLADGSQVRLGGSVIGAPYAEQVRTGEIPQIQVELG
jgi:hypothetical protein